MGVISFIRKYYLLLLFISCGFCFSGCHLYNIDPDVKELEVILNHSIDSIYQSVIVGDSVYTYQTSGDNKIGLYYKINVHNRYINIYPRIYKSDIDNYDKTIEGYKDWMIRVLEKELKYKDLCKTCGYSVNRDCVVIDCRIKQEQDSGLWVDLGLPSGTLWCKENIREKNFDGQYEYYYTYPTTTHFYLYDTIPCDCPTREQWQELLDYCDRDGCRDVTFTSRLYNTSITIPGIGFVFPDFSWEPLAKGKEDYYLTTTPGDVQDETIVFNLSNKNFLSATNHVNTFAVRPVKCIDNK